MVEIFKQISFISPIQLRNMLDDGEAVRIIDASWHMPNSGRDAVQEYKAGHIPSAIFFDLDFFVDQDSDLPHMLPDADFFTLEIGKLGVSSNDNIVIYDQSGLFSAARAAWSLKIFGAKNVKILEGGLPAWKQAGYSVSSEIVRLPTTSFVANFDSSSVVDCARIQKIIKDGGSQIVDARSAARFQGEVQEPRANVRSGYIPSSFNLPFDSLIANGALQSADYIRQKAIEAGIYPKNSVICSCGSGVTAVVLALALTKAGIEVEAIYDGSWAEWGSRADLPIAKGI